VTGVERNNVALALARAKAGAEALEVLGIPANHIIICSVGSEFPAEKPAGTDNKALDRRILIMRIPDPYANPDQLHMPKTPTKP
jgi:outer membrane protein OmpA-like peptidoglycan-associated protein